MSSKTAKDRSPNDGDEAAVAAPRITALAPWLAVQRDHVLSQQGHAWLLHGPSGLGQYAIALSVAQAWLCEAPNRQSGDAACGQCASCHLIERGAHPDLAVLMPETLMLELGWPLGEKAQNDIDDKKRKPSREIRVEAMREVVEFAQLTSGRARGQAVLVYPAERMNPITANALLKTLEEPSGATRFILATEAAHALLPTIRSRCQSVALQWPSEEQALTYLESIVGSADASAHTAAYTTAQLRNALMASGGRPLDAAALLQSGASAAWAQWPRAMANGHVGAVADWSPYDLLESLQKLCHDLWAVKTGAVPRYFAATDLPRPPPARALAAWSEQLKTLRRSIEHPYKAELLIEDLVSQARIALHSRQ